jgi:response regulator NasT
MDLIVVTDRLDSAQPLMEAASEYGHRLLKVIGINDSAKKFVSSLLPDVLIFISNEVDRTLLREMHAVNEAQPTPMIVFTSDSGDEAIYAAVKAGATAFIVDCNDPSRLGSLLGVAKARFEEQQRLIDELKQTKSALQERKSVERAKGIIMKSKRLSEDQAYKAMRKLAMNHNKRIGEIAEQIISASEILT